jgi:hypothetical protein
MDKKDIYEHLAKIYLDTPATKRRKTKSVPKDYRHFVIIGAAIVLGFILLLTSRIFMRRSMDQGYALILSNDPIRMHFAFDPAKKEVFSFDLNKSNLSRYKALGFSAKRSNFDDIISLRIEFTNIYKEKSEVYIKDLPHKWQHYKLAFADFKGISDWSEMENLAFIIEEWNTKDTKGIVYLDNVRLFK